MNPQGTPARDYYRTEAHAIFNSKDAVSTILGRAKTYAKRNHVSSQSNP